MEAASTGALCGRATESPLFIFKEVNKKMDQETEGLMTELYRLFGRLRYALMETQAGMAQIMGKAQSMALESDGTG